MNDHPMPPDFFSPPLKPATELSLSSAAPPAPEPEPPKAPQKTATQVMLDRVVAYFQSEFPLDWLKAFGKFFAKRGHKACEGRGILTYLNPDDPKRASLNLCSCSRKRRDRYVDEAIKFARILEAKGKATAELHCDVALLKLPVNLNKASEEMEMQRLKALRDSMAAGSKMTVNGR